MKNKLLIPAARQYMHNDGSGLLCGYDKEITEKLVSEMLHIIKGINDFGEVYFESEENTKRLRKIIAAI